MLQKQKLAFVLAGYIAWTVITMVACVTLIDITGFDNVWRSLTSIIIAAIGALHLVSVVHTEDVRCKWHIAQLSLSPVVVIAAAISYAAKQDLTWYLLTVFAIAAFIGLIALFNAQLRHRTVVDALNAKIAEINEASKHYFERVQELVKAASDAKIVIENLKKSNAALQQQLDTAQASNVLHEQDLSMLRAANDRLTAECDELKNNLLQAKSDLDKALQTTVSEAIVADMKAENAKLTAALQETQTNLERALYDLQFTRKNLTAMQNNYNALRDKHKSLEAKVAEKMTKIKDAEAILEKQEKQRQQRNAKRREATAKRREATAKRRSERAKSNENKEEQ